MALFDGVPQNSVDSDHGALSSRTSNFDIACVYDVMVLTNF
jgi:hypothetical protein